MIQEVGVLFRNCLMNIHIITKNLIFSEQMMHDALLHTE